MKIILGSIVVLLILIGGYVFIFKGNETSAPTLAPQDTSKIYSNADYGISFTYPETYVLTERALGNGERFHHNITLMDREAAANISQNGEGPTAITIDFIQNDIEKLSIKDWINNDSRSNFKLSPDGELISTTIAGKEALTYTWDGLYRGHSIVFTHKDAIVMYSVTYMTLDDHIVSDSIDIFESIEFLE